MKQILPILLLILLITAPIAVAQGLNVVILYLPDSVREIARTNETLRVELRQGLTRLWGMDTNDSARQAWADMGWLPCRNGSETGWAYVVTMRQTANRLDDDTLFVRWRTHIRALGGDLWRRVDIWTNTGLEPAP